MTLLMLMLMLLSTASARTLKDSGDDLYQAERTCSYLYICATNELVGNKTLTTNNPDPNHGDKVNDIRHYDAGWCISFRQTGYGPEVDIEFYLDHDLVHKGYYQQNYCGLMAGAITTNDPNAEIREGSFTSPSRPGYVIIKAWK